VTDLRPAVVALLVDVYDPSAFPALVRSSTGEPFSADEIASMGGATLGELKAAEHALAEWFLERVEFGGVL
jgi:hypothetical protein